MNLRYILKFQECMTVMLLVVGRANAIHSHIVQFTVSVMWILTEKIGPVW